MPVGASCTYKVFANCSWPSFEVNSTEVDLWVTSFKGKKNDKSEADGSTTFQKAQKNGNKIRAEPPAENRTSECDDTQIRMYVTVTRTAATPALLSESFLMEEARVLQASTPISFQVTVAGNGNMGSYIKAGFVAIVAMISMLAF